MNLKIHQALFFFILPFLIFSTNIEDMAKRETDTFWKYYYDENDTSTFPFDEPSVLVQNDILNTNRKASILSKLNEYYPDWMSKISNSRRIDTITMPGTHDTCARHGYPLFKCQDRTLEEQLTMGVRLIDIRCRHINDVFMIHHERSYQKLSFGSGVRDVCVNFLKKHPTEFIFMLVQEEWKPKDNSRTFDETMYSYINCDEYRDYFYLSENELPSIEKVRGKIVLLRRFNKDTLSNVDMGNYIRFADNDFFESKYTITTYGQDCYTVSSLFARSSKYKKVEEFFEKPKNFKHSSHTTLFLNFGSGQSLICYPYSVAEYVTPRVGEYVEKSFPNDFLGIVIFDFVNRYYPKIIYHVIKRNFLPERNGGLPNTFTICDPENCTNKANGTNKLYVALVVIAAIVVVALIVLLIVFIVIRYKRKKSQQNISENEASFDPSEKDEDSYQ